MTHGDTAPFDRVLHGQIVTPTGTIPRGWIAIRGGRIAAIGDGASPAAQVTGDYGDALLLPGVIDGQVHACSWRGLAGLATTTRSAVAGGVTTIVDMPYDDPDPLTSVELLRVKQRAIDRLAHCDVALYATLAKDQPASDIVALAQAGICAIKISSFENHPSRFPRIESDQMLEILQVASTIGIAVGLHNEDQAIVRAATERLKAAGYNDIFAHSASRPVAAEMSATAQFLELAAATGAHAHIVHLSVPRGFDLVEHYAGRGFRATAEMCVHYLLLDEAEDGGRIGALMKVNPPIRSGVREGLWAALEAGQVAFVSSDHSGWPIERKRASNIYAVAAGVPGLETLLPGFYSALVQRGLDAPSMTARYLSEGPAKFFGLWPRKGALVVGADADITVLSPDDWIYDSRQAHDDLNWSPFDGARFVGRVTSTYVRGELALNLGEVVSHAGMGRFCPGQAQWHAGMEKPQG